VVTGGAQEVPHGGRCRHRLPPVDPLDGVTIPALDFTDEDADARLRRRSAGEADLVLSTWREHGRPPADRSPPHHGLVELGLEFAMDVLKPAALCRQGAGGGTDHQLLAELKQHFTTVKHAKPPASRKDSSEWYVVAQGFKGRQPSPRPLAGEGDSPAGERGEGLLLPD
jgi:23S rRNA (uridine2552-2'-O)-methyltransferase